MIQLSRTYDCNICLVSLPPGTRVCASGVVSHAGRLPPVPGCGWRHGVSSYILHPFLFHPGDCHQRAAPHSQSGSAGWDVASDTHTGHKGAMTCGWYWLVVTGCYCVRPSSVSEYQKCFTGIIIYLHLCCVLVFGLLGGQCSLPPSQTWSAQPAMEADASLRAPQRSVFCQCTQGY